jgi:hypothetical protein
MEFTKIEKRILSGKGQKINKIGLYLGIIFIFISLAVVVYTNHNAEKIYSPFQNKYLLIDKDVFPKTELEIKLKKSLLKAVEKTGEAWSNYAVEKGLETATFFMLLGIFLVGDYFGNKIYLNLIKKLNKNLTTQSSGREPPLN